MISSKSIEDAGKEIDLDYIREDIPNAIGQSLEGIDRISGIVQVDEGILASRIRGEDRHRSQQSDRKHDHGCPK